jgi:FdhD protein
MSRLTTDLAAVDESPVWLEVNGRPTVTWMCTPDQLEELVVGWLHGEGYIRSVDDIRSLVPCATDLGFRVEVPPEQVDAVASDGRRRVLASGCGAVSVALADPASLSPCIGRGTVPAPEVLRALFKDTFQRGRRYQETGGIHAAALTDGNGLLAHAEDVGRHNAVDKVIGTALLARRDPQGLGMLVTGRISAELAFKAARAGIAWVATVSVPTTLAAVIARRAGVTLVGRAVSGHPHVHRPDA